MTMFLSRPLPRSDWGLIGAAGVLLTLAYPPFSLVVPPFVCLVPAALLILGGASDQDPWRRHLHQGFWYGTVTHGVLFYWLAGALWRFGPGAVPLLGVAAVIFGGATAVMFALVGRAVGRSPRRILVALPAGVVFMEWLAAQVGPIALPWHQLALTVTGLPVFLQTADIAGAGGLAFILATVNAALALAWWSRRNRGAAFAHLEVAATVLLLMTLYGLHRLNTLPLAPGAQVAVVQPNVAPQDKWTAAGKDAVVEAAARLAERAIAEARPAFVALPETALPDVVASHPQWTARLTRLARRSGSMILTGGVETEPGGDGQPRRYNAAFAIRPGGGAASGVIHRKQKLIPMVERVPSTLLDLSRTGFGGFTPGSALRVVDSPMGSLGTLLCYELTFADMARELRRSGAEVLVTLSNDAWSGRTASSYQHFAHASVRAVENRVTVIRAANTGVSGIVDPLGRVVARTDPYVEAYAVGRVQHTRVEPLAAHLGGLVGPLCLGLMVLLLLPVRVRARAGLRSLPPRITLVSPAAAAAGAEPTRRAHHRGAGTPTPHARPNDGHLSLTVR